MRNKFVDNNNRKKISGKKQWGEGLQRITIGRNLTENNN